MKKIIHQKMNLDLVMVIVLKKYYLNGMNKQQVLKSSQIVACTVILNFHA